MTLSGIDQGITEWVADHRTPWATSAAEALQTVGTERPWIRVIALVAIAVVVAFRAWFVAGAVVAALVASTVIVAVLKPIVARSRPPADLALSHLSGYALPSGEAVRTAAASTALMLVVGWTSRRVMLVCGALLATACVLVGVAMVYLGGHWTGDVLVGWPIGIAIGAGVGFAVRRLPAWRRRHPATIPAVSG